MKHFNVGEAVLIRRSPGSPMWIEATYLGLYTIHYGERPWHLVQVNADKYSVPVNRIKRAKILDGGKR